MQQMNRKIGVGVLWNIGSLFLTRGASVIFTLFLAFFLAPDVFGLLAMITVVVELANSFIESGLGQAIIRSKKISQIDLCTVFISNMGMSLLAYGVLFFTASYVADFYRQPELVLLIQVVGLVLIVNAAKVVQVAVLSRDMNFKVQMKANTAGVVVSGILAVFVAYLGAGVWSLVVQMLTASVVSAVVLWFSSGWRPERQFSLGSLLRMFQFAGPLLAAVIIDVLYRNAHVLVIGRLFSAEMTGLYFFAKKFSQLISQQLTDAVQKSTLPALSTLQDDNAMLRLKYRQVIQLTMFVISPIMLLIVALAEPLFTLLFDDQWIDAVPYTQLLCIIGILYPLHSLNINILSVKGRSDLILKVGLIIKSVNVAFLFAAIPFGVLAIVISQVVGSSLALLPNTYFSARLIDYGLVDQLLDVFRPILAATIAAICAWFYADMSTLPIYLVLIISGNIMLFIYLILSLVLRAEGFCMIINKLKSIGLSQN